MAKKIALGLGNNTDYEIAWDSNVIVEYIQLHNINSAEIKNIVEITNERELIISILFFLKTGSGGERYVRDLRVIEDFSQHFCMTITIGGTAPRAAIAMAKLGYASCLHLVTMNEHMRRLLPPECEWVCSTMHDSSYPHLIIQFPAHTIVQARDIYIETIRPNRIIYDNDYDNIQMKLNVRFFTEYLGSAKVLLLSGFNAMHSPELLKERVDFLRTHLSKCKKSMVVFYEDACFKDFEMTRIVRDNLLEFVAIYSLNEDELQAYVGAQIDLLSPIAVLAALEKLQQFLRVPLIITHTRYWALAYGKNACSYEAAVKGGITMATTRFRFGNDFTSEQYQQTYKLPEEEKGGVFSRSINKIGDGVVCCLPSVQVTETNITTIGLGDAFVGGFLPVLV